MTNPTSNFGWQMPTSTDLVTDLPADFEVFGQAVDTSLADLKGGTTGQVLAKASNTNMDFSWVAIDPLVILDAKGDLITATAADTPARLAVGTNNQVLTADSSTATGLKWATAASGGMTEIATGSLSGTTVTISSIPTTYKNLELVLRDPALSGNADTMRLRFNSNSSSIYGSVQFNGTSAFVANTSSSFNIGYLPAEADSLMYTTVQDYANTSTHKGQQTLLYGNSSTTNQVVLNNAWGLMGSTSAVTSISLFSDSLYTFSAGTYILYGVS